MKMLLIWGLVGSGLGASVAVGGVKTYQGVSIDTASVPTIVNGATATYADD